MSVISINYNDGGDPLGYESVQFSFGFSNEKKIFNSGNFVQDWFDMRKFMIMEYDNSKDPYSSYSSSVDHFIMDGAPYESAYLKPVDDKSEKWFLDYEYDFQNQGIEFFVPEGTRPTWEELKTMCGWVKEKVENQSK